MSNAVFSFAYVLMGTTILFTPFSAAQAQGFRFLQAGQSEYISGYSSAKDNAITTRVTITHLYDFPDTPPASISSSTATFNKCPKPEVTSSSGGRCAGADESTGGVCGSMFSSSCFSYDTHILMSDGTHKKIGEIGAGDDTAYGIVNQTYIRRFDQSLAATRDFQIVYRGGLYEYRGILVTGNHMVKDRGSWAAVADLPDVRPVFAPHVGNVYNLDVEGGVIPVIDADGRVIPFLDDKQFLSAKYLAA